VESSPQDTEIYSFRKRRNEFKEFFSQETEILFFNDVCSVTEVLGHQQVPTESVCLLTFQN
jgi:hypothetical protein